MPTLTRVRRLRPRRPQLERETPIVARAVAEGVIEELTVYFGHEIPRRYVAWLTFRAHRCFAHSQSFREKIRRPGEQGRDLLYVFMRHWLAARLYDERPEWFARLPREYVVGRAPDPARSR